MNKSKLDVYKEKFAKLEKENFARMNLKEGEQVKHCIDNSHKRYYQIKWAVTSEGRVWSLSRNMWLNPRYENKYWRVENDYVHLLVDYYFITEKEENIKKLAEKNNKKLEVHHLERIEEVNMSVMTKKERIDACMKVNKKSNLMLQVVEDHDDIHKIKKGKSELGKDEAGFERKVEFDSMTSIMINSDASIYFTYDENDKREINTKRTFPTLTPEEEKMYAKEFETQTDKPKRIFMFTA